MFLRPLLIVWGFCVFGLVLTLPTASQGGQPLMTPTPPSALGAPAAIAPQPAAFTDAAGWSCEDFPCEDDLDGWLKRIQAAPGFAVDLYGQFPGQPMQIAFGPDGRLYATVLENGTRYGAVYALSRTDGIARISETLISPVGLAFAPGTNTLYVTSRLDEPQRGALWRIEPDGAGVLLLDDLPCCYNAVTAQPQGVTFGPDGYLYLGVSSVSDHAEPSNPQHQRYATPQPYEASILRVQPQNGAVEVYAEGIRDPQDLAFAPDGRLYATDNGMLIDGIGDRVLSVDAGAHYGFPFWRNRGCELCPPTDYSLSVPPDLLTLPPYTLPRGITVYTGAQFPQNYFGSVFVALWNGTPTAQRIVRIDPATIPTDPDALAQYTPEPFVTGLIRPVDVTVAPDGTLLVADFIYGFVWRVAWTGILPPAPTPTSAPFVFATNTPQP